MDQLDLFSGNPSNPPPRRFETSEQLDARIVASKIAGNVHLDQVQSYVETMKGRRIVNAHDPLEQGTVLTVSNHRDVVVRWADAYSASKNHLGIYDVTNRRTGKVIEQRSWLSSSDLKDYILLGASFETEVQKGNITSAAIHERNRLIDRQAEQYRPNAYAQPTVDHSQEMER